MTSLNSPRQWHRLTTNEVLSTVGSSVNGLDKSSLTKNLKQYGYIQPLFIPKWLRPYFKYQAIRSGKSEQITSQEMILGDILILNKGDIVPGLMRVIKVNDATVQEHDITGISAPISKNSLAIQSIAPINQQKNMLFAGTYIESGSVVAVLVGGSQKNKILKIKQSIKFKRNNIITSIDNAKKISNCNAVIFDGLTKPQDIKDSFRELYIKNQISCLYLLDFDNIKKITTDFPEIIPLQKSNRTGVFVTLKKPYLDTNVKDFIKSNKTIYLGPDAGNDPVSLASTVAIVAGNQYTQIGLFKCKSITINLSPSNLTSILYNIK
ncbi:MAG: hypothetical protein MUF85_00600 [Patescibacteria group bacterium]|jgi:hypothetical protein|nr:hypothetical protein [Patescibacteria group bacterium]